MKSRFMCSWLPILCVMVSLGFVEVTHAQTQQPTTFAGIEVGAGGVKSVILTFNPNGPIRWVQKEQKPSSTVSTPLVAQNFSEDVINSVVTVATELEKSLPATVPRNQRFIVLSSGVVMQAKLTSKSAALTQLRSQLLSSTGINPDEINVESEVRFAFDELTEQMVASDREKTLLIDIGSGNTKFCLMKRGELKTGKIGRGIGSELASRFREKGREAAAIESLRNDATNELRTEIEREQVSNLPVSQAYVLGGAFFSLMGYSQPEDLAVSEEAAKSYAILRPDSLSKYQKWVLASSEAPPVLEGLTPPKLDKALETFKLSQKVISLESRRPALALIEASLLAFNLSSEKVETRFPKEGQFAWIRGYVRHKADSANVAK